MEIIGKTFVQCNDKNLLESFGQYLKRNQKMPIDCMLAFKDLFKRTKISFRFLITRLLSKVYFLLFKNDIMHKHLT